MKRTISFQVGCLTLAGLAWVTTLGIAEDDPMPGKPDGADRPFLALWRQSGGRAGLDTPYLRFAVWADGRVLFATDPNKWGHQLRRGKLSPARIARLKTALADTGVFDLRGTCYLVPDGPVDCLMAELGGKQQTLYWDEVETPGYGINIDPKPRHREFKRCWKAVNHLALVALPDDGEVVKERIPVPESWYLKPAVQSD
jgi:hypothetical protein